MLCVVRQRGKERIHYGQGGRLEIAGVRAGSAALLVITVVAAMQLLGTLNGTFRTFPGHLGLVGLAIAAVLVVVAVAAVWAMDRLARSRVSTLALVVVGMLLVALPRIAASVVLDAPLVGDTLAYHDLALGVLDGVCCFAHRPMGYPILLAGSYAVFGDGPFASESLNIVLAMVGGALLFDAARLIWGRRGAALSLALYAVLPSQVLIVVPPLTEVLYATLLIGICWVIVRSPRLGSTTLAAGGALLGLSQYVRPTSQVLLPLLALLPLALRGLRHGIAAAVIGVACFVAVLLPVVGYNLAAHGDLSLSTSAYAGWSLFVGANQESNGMWNRHDADLLASFPGTSQWDRSEVAGREAWGRITRDPLGYAELLVRKVGVMWADESYVGQYATGPGIDERVREALVVGADVMYAIVLGVALVATVGVRARPPPVVTFVVAAILLIAILHLFVEVHSRYHAYLEPLAALLAGGALAWRQRSRALAVSDR